MGSKNNTFLWEGDRDRALAEARRGGCALDLWFKLAEQRARYHQEFSAWLRDVHARHRARFGKAAAQLAV
ncbi:MAG TPA: hypothetical protein VKE95_09270 [Burkholderiales bacterium]|nr:hypothetical protein [Burkholderiales bacterium]